MSLARWIAALLGLVLLLAACDFHGPYHVPWTKEKYRRWEAPGRYGGTNGRQNVYWIDDDRVLYVGTDEDDQKHSRTTLRIWTLSTGAIEILGPSLGELCYFRGFVKHWERRSGLAAVEKEGVLGGLLETFPDATARHRRLIDEGYLQHDINCRWYRRNDLDPGGHCKVPLLFGDGYLEVKGGRCEPAMQKRLQPLLKERSESHAAREELLRIDEELARRPVRYFPEGGSPISLPIEANEFRSRGPNGKFVEWRKQYLMLQWSGKGESTHNHGPWPTDQDLVAYLLSPDGTLDRVSVPITSHFFMRPHALEVTRAGPVVMTPGLARDRKTSYFGLVMYVARQPVILDDALTREMTLAPGGCRIAYSRQTGTLAGDYGPVVRRLRVIDLCVRTG